jgi:diguanylate cyclase
LRVLYSRRQGRDHRRENYWRIAVLSDVGDALSLQLLEREYAEQSNVLEVIKLANDLKQALSRRELFLQYQPIVDLNTAEVIGLETLMRWNHPENGIIPPDEFIPMAEDSGLIVEATEWAFRESCLFLKRIERELSSTNPLFMSINFSATDFEEINFFEKFSAILEETHTGPERIHLEITERLLLQQPTNVKITLQKCRDAGMGVAIDDFGTGYSSLSYLHEYPINILKIDRSFVQKMSNDLLSRGFIKSILSLSENMGMKIIAEGVEMLEEVQLLREMNCSIAQGYFFSRPMTEADLISSLLIDKA